MPILNGTGAKGNTLTSKYYSQYNAHLKSKIHALPVVELTSNLLSSLKAQLLKTPIGNTKPKKAVGKSNTKARNGKLWPDRP